MNKTMIRIKVQYDAANRSFKLLDNVFKTLLEGDGLYDLNLPVIMYDEAELEELVPPGQTAVAHA
jgi:hypothetical protein